jgi:hypothetical protein
MIDFGTKVKCKTTGFLTRYPQNRMQKVAERLSGKGFAH